MNDLYMDVDQWNPNFVFVKGWVTVKNGECVFTEKEYDYLPIMGWGEGDLINDSFENHEYKTRAKDGVYKFVALLDYNSPQIGGYPPPNIEVPEHFEISFISVRGRIK